MLRKLDVLILKSFVGPFVLTTLVATFVLLIQYMMKYFDDFVGKDLGAEVFAELLFYFSLNMLQVALPLGVLVSSLMTFGNLGENFELTAIKSAGISLVRALRPIFFFVILLTYFAFHFNNYVVPAANLKAYSLLYDIKHKKPALDIKEGVFYNGIPDYSIKVQEKLKDNKTLKNVLIYDHTSGLGNNRVILADSSRMFMMFNDSYLKLELYNGNYYAEEPKARSTVDQFFRTKFDRMDMVFNLSSFDLKRTKEELFQNNRQMKNISELDKDIDSLGYTLIETKNSFLKNAKGFFSYHLDSITVKLDKPIQSATNFKELNEVPDTLREITASMLPIALFEPEQIGQRLKSDTLVRQLDPLKSKRIRNLAEKKERKDSLIQGEIQELDTEMEFNEIEGRIGLIKTKENARIDTLSWDFLNEAQSYKKEDILQTARNQAQNVKINIGSIASRADNLERDLRKFIIEKHKKYSQAFACIVMFLIGAPLGSIIKKGGLGVPVIVAIMFFLLYYIIGIICEKSAKEGVMDPMWSVWVADLVLLPVGLFFLRQARIDAKLFDTDFYNVWIDRLKIRFTKSPK
ncbi:MAG: lipopolysaccharide export system permease protein [Marinoscillum sp.]|jgi:lipopolysaccharide export system permease protein